MQYMTLIQLTATIYAMGIMDEGVFDDINENEAVNGEVTKIKTVVIA